MDGTTQTSALITQTSTPAPTPVQNAAPPIATGLDWTTIIVAIVTGVTTGLLAPMVAPYMTWYFKRKERQEERHREIIDEFRAILDDEANFDRVTSIFEHYNFPHIESSIDTKTAKRLRELKTMSEVHGGPLDDEIVCSFREVLTRLEKKWGLVGK
jgi:hypothetical protein